MSAKPARVLLVEGRDDREVVFQICNRHCINNRELFEVVAKDGYDSLKDDLTVRPLTDVEVIGAIVDADVDPDARWASMCEALAEAEYKDLPELPCEEGTIIPAQGKLPCVGIWLMPNNRLAGILEDFLSFLISQDDVLLEQARLCIEGIPKEERLFRDSYRSKALIHTWLAWQEEPGTPLGLAVTRRYLGCDHELVKQFLAWLTRLFPGDQ